MLKQREQVIGNLNVMKFSNNKLISKGDDEI